MSQENVEIVRRAFEQWQQGGETLDAIPVEFYAEDVEWDQSTYRLVDFPDRGAGRDNLLDALATYLSGWTSYQAEPTEFIDAGENVFTVLHEKAGIGDSGAIVERDLFHVWTLSNGRCVKWQTFQTREEALEAARLSE